MESREIERRVRDLTKATNANESASVLQSLLDDLRANVIATEDLLRTTKVGKAVNRLRTHKDPSIARASGDLVLKWKRDMKSESGSGQKSGAATPRDDEGAKSAATNGVAGSKDGNGKLEKGAFKSSVPLDQRSSQTDKVDTRLTGNTVRDSCLKLMYDGLAITTSEPPQLVLSIASAIETSALSALGPESRPEYKTKIRSLFQNLKNKSNPGLRLRVLSGEVAPDRLVRMSLEELKSPERRAEDKQMQKENMDKAMVAQEEKSISSSLQCGKCQQKKVSYSQAQTRSADEPMTTFCECTVCGNRWKFS